MIAQPPSVAEFLAIEYPRGRHLDPKTLQQMGISVRLLDRWASKSGRPAPVALADLSRDLICDWIAWLRESRSAKTVNNKRGDVMTLWREANRLGLCGPADEIRKVREPKREPVVWTLQQIDAIFAACDRLTGQWEGVPVPMAWRIALLLFWDTAGRLDEIFRAEIVHLRPADRALFVPAEHRKGQTEDRLYSLHVQTWDAIAATLPSARRRIFPFPYKRRQIWGHLRKILRAAGLPDDRAHMFHCFRRSAESYAAAQESVAWAAEAVGHSEAVARRHYISRQIAPGPRLVDALPRPIVGPDGGQSPQAAALEAFAGPERERTADRPRLRLFAG